MLRALSFKGDILSGVPIHFLTYCFIALFCLGNDRAKAQAGIEATINSDGSQSFPADHDLYLLNVVTPFVEKDTEATLASIKKIPIGSKSADVLLIESRCQQMKGNTNSALVAAGTLIQQKASYESWVRGDPRLMAVTLGANAAMELGQNDKVIQWGWEGGGDACDARILQ